MNPENSEDALPEVPDSGLPVFPPPEGFDPQKLFRLPNGQLLDLSEWTNTDLRSAFIIEPWSAGHRWELFTYGRGQKITGTEITATRAHTNIPRTGDSGLPRDWEMYVTRWRAQTNIRLTQPVLDWAAETHVQFEYNGKYYGDSPLLDLLLHPQPVGDPLPIHMRENLMYGATLESSPVATAALREALRGDAIASNVRDALTELDTIIRLQKDGPIVTSLRHVQAKLAAGQSMTLWLHLEGPIKRVIV